MILAHAKAYRTYESTYKSEQNGEISITDPLYQIADPLYLGDYPKEMKDQIKKIING